MNSPQVQLFEYVGHGEGRGLRHRIIHPDQRCPSTIEDDDVITTSLFDNGPSHMVSERASQKVQSWLVGSGILCGVGRVSEPCAGSIEVIT